MRKVRVFLLAFGVVALLVWAQDPKQALQQRIAEARKSIAENQARLKAYQWVETTEVSLKGEVKKREQKECRYGPDGKVVKTPIGEPPEPPKAKRGLKGKVVAKKVDELKDYMDRFGSLIRRYVPPDPSVMQTASQSGRAALDRSSGVLAFNDYAKPGDTVTLTFDTAARKLRAYSVATYLDGPEDAVTLDVRWSALADGTSFVEEVLLKSEAKKMQIRITSFDHKKL